MFFSDGVNVIPTCAIGFVFASVPTPSPPHPAEQASAASFAGQLAAPSHQARVQSPYLSRSSFLELRVSRTARARRVPTYSTLPRLLAASQRLFASLFNATRATNGRVQTSFLSQALLSTLAVRAIISQAHLLPFPSKLSPVIWAQGRSPPLPRQLPSPAAFVPFVFLALRVVTSFSQTMRYPSTPFRTSCSCATTWRPLASPSPGAGGSPVPARANALSRVADRFLQPASTPAASLPNSVLPCAATCAVPSVSL